MATAMTQAPGDRRNWDRVQDQLNIVKAKEAELMEAKSGLQSLMLRMFGEDGPNIIKTKHRDNRPEPTSSPTRRPAPQQRETRGGTKKEFVEQMFLKNHAATLKEIQDAWIEAGHEGSLSGSLFYKTKGELTANGQIERGRRGRGKKSTTSGAANMGSAKTNSHIKAASVTEVDEEIHQSIQEVALEILARDEHRKKGLTVSEIVEVMEEDKIVPDLPNDQDIDDIISHEMKVLRDNGTVERGDNRAFRLVN